MKLTAVKFKVNENKETRQKKFLEKWKILVGGGSLQAVQFVLFCYSLQVCLSSFVVLFTMQFVGL